MKTLETAEQAVVSGAAESTTMTIAANSKAFKELISGIYSDKALAITRELFANALDSHVEAGCPEKPFKVILPNAMEPSFSVRDYGVSMSHDMVMRLYATLFESTKDDPNSERSNTMTGKFGLGSKTPFAYTDAFQLVTYKDGQARTYDIYMNGGMPTVSLFVTETTEEPDGVLVTFPVEVADHDDFRRAARQSLIPFDVKPEINKNFEFLESEVIREADNWKMFGDGYYVDSIFRTFSVRQGTVLYPLNKNAVPNLPSELDYLFSLPIHFTVDIGMLEVNTAREALSYDDRTSKNLIAALTELDKSLRESYSEIVRSANTFAEFVNNVDAACRGASSRLESNVIKVLTYKGRPYQAHADLRVKYKLKKHTDESGYIGYNRENLGISVCHYSRDDVRNLRNIYFREWRNIAFRDMMDVGYFTIGSRVGLKTVYVFENTEDTIRGYNARFRTLINKYGTDCDYIWVRSDSEQAAHKFFKKYHVRMGRPDFEYVSLSDVEMAVLDGSDGYTAFDLPDYKALSSGGSMFSTPSNHTPPEFAVYVNLYRNDPEFTDNFSLSTYVEAYRYLVDQGIIDDLPVIGINRSNARLIKNYEGWQPLEDVVKAHAAKAIDPNYLDFFKLNEARTEMRDYSAQYDLVRNMYHNLASDMSGRRSRKYIESPVSAVKYNLKCQMKATSAWDLFSIQRRVDGLWDTYNRKFSSVYERKQNAIIKIAGEEAVKAATPQTSKFSSLLEEVKIVGTLFDEEFPLVPHFRYYSEREEQVINYMKMKRPEKDVTIWK